jgi:ankyrin repeat protein
MENEHKQRTLHQAAANNSLQVAQLLIDRGAEIDPRETQWGGTPIGWASHGDHTEMLELLSKYSRNVWTLSYRGYVDRLREVLRNEPDRAKTVTDEGITPLWWLPDDEATALEIIDLFVAAGADPLAKDKSGTTAADWGRKRGMLKVIERLTAGIDHAAPGKKANESASSEVFESLAKDLLVAYESGYQPALDRLNKHYRTSMTWDGLRESVQKRLRSIPKAELPMNEMYEGYFALPHAKLLVARSAGFNDWNELQSQAGAP